MALRTVAVGTMMLMAVALVSGPATASSSAPSCRLAASTLPPRHVTSMSAVLRGRVTACGAHGVTAWFIIDGSPGNGWVVTGGRRPMLETELLVDLGPGMRVTYRMAVQHGGKVVRGRRVSFTVP